MSLDITLIVDYTIEKSWSGVFIREGGQTKQVDPLDVVRYFPLAEDLSPGTIETNEVWTVNITHNLAPMASEVKVDDAGHTLYDVMWRPENLKVTTAQQIITPLQIASQYMSRHREYLKLLNPRNGWGNSELLFSVVNEYLTACQEHPQAKIEISR